MAWLATTSPATKLRVEELYGVDVRRLDTRPDLGPARTARRDGDHRHHQRLHIAGHRGRGDRCIRREGCRANRGRGHTSEHRADAGTGVDETRRRDSLVVQTLVVRVVGSLQVDHDVRARALLYTQTCPFATPICTRLATTCPAT